MAKIVTIVGSFLIGLTMRTHRMPVFGESLPATDFDMGPGGKGSNQAVAAARLGAQVSFASIIGDDALGKIGVDLYASEGVNTDYLQQTSARGTGAAFIIVDQTGRNGIVVDSSACKLMDAAFVDTCEAQIARSDIVVSGLEMPAEAAVRTMQLGKQHGIRTLLNPAPAVPLPDDVFPLIDYMTPNETELRILMGLAPDDSTPTLELAKRLQARGTKHLIVTMGENGAMILSGDQVTEVAGLKVDVVDTTGAGDAFSAGLAVALVEGRPLLEAVRFANCCGALACTKLGVIPALAQRSAVDQLYAQYYG